MSDPKPFTRALVGVWLIALGWFTGAVHQIRESRPAFAMQEELAPQEPSQARHASLPAARSSKMGIQSKIRVAAALRGVNEAAALRIANCESGFKWDAASKTSSAKGVYQFLDSTWKAIGAEGHQFDEDENINQFMLHYPGNPGMWECK